MALDYKRAEALWAQKRMKDYKPMEIDLRLRKLEDGSFTVHRVRGSWNGQKWAKGESLFATLTPSNLLTLCVETRPCQTEANRMSALLGCMVNLNANRYRGYESTVRVHSVGLIKSSIPYHTGLTFDMTPRGPVCVNPVADRKTVKSPEMKTQMSKELDTLRKVVIGMARMGAFDDVILNKINRQYHSQSVRSIDEVNIEDPTAEDALAVFVSGLRNADASHYSWRSGTYNKISTEELTQSLRKKAVTNGLSHLREYLYRTRNGYTQVPA